MCRSLAWTPRLCSSCPPRFMFSFIDENFPESPLRNMGEQRERDLVLTALHLPALDRGHRDSGQLRSPVLGEGVEDATCRGGLGPECSWAGLFKPRASWQTTSAACPLSRQHG